MNAMISEPHKVKTVRRTTFTTMAERLETLKGVGFNTFNVRSGQVTFDMTSQGCSAMSQEQFARSFVGDEAYAGARSFLQLREAASAVLGHEKLCPTHNRTGSIKLISTTMVNEGDKVLGNSFFPRGMTEQRQASMRLVRTDREDGFTGDIDLDRVQRELDEGPGVPYLYVEAYADGYMPVSLDNLKEVRRLAHERGFFLVLDVSRVVEDAMFIRENEAGQSGRTLADIVKDIVSTSHVCIMDAGQDARSNVGGLISTDIPELQEKYETEVVVYEGLHTYGGMTGRTMGVFAGGLEEMLNENQARWIDQQVALFADGLSGLPVIRGADGVYLRADRFLPDIESHQAHALAAALYLKSGVRTFLEGRFEDANVLPVQVPRLAFNNRQIEQVAGAIRDLYEERDRINGFSICNDPDWHDEAVFQWDPDGIGEYGFDCEPYTIHTFEYVGITSREEREKAVQEGGYNTFLLMSEDVEVDLLTDSGTCAMSIEQWQKYIGGTDTPATSEDYLDFVEAVRELTGYKHVMPTHQGRAAEHVLSQIMIEGEYVPGNMYFTTTKLHQEMAGGKFVDIIVDEAHDPTSHFPWKGNIDLNKLDDVVKEHGADKIHYVSFEMSVNMAGGQPFSMENAHEVYAYCREHGIPLMFDATRSAENFYMIQKRDPKYKDVPIKQIAREVFDHGDGVTWSSKKDPLVNIGGFQAIREDGALFKKYTDMIRNWEGSITTGGLSAGDLAAQAQGLREMVEDEYIKNRVEQTHYLGRMLVEAGVPIIEPPGGHAIFIDAKRFLPHIDQDEYPAQALSAAIFTECGVRSMERGNISKGRNPETGENYRPPLELVRVTIPRRAYTFSHMERAAQGIISLYKRRDTIRGLRFTYETPVLRFFQSRFEEV